MQCSALHRGEATLSVQSIRDYLARHGLTPNRDLGQNFLIDEALVEKLVTAVGVGAQDTVIEIGAGLGILTRALAARAQRVVALEIDAGLVRALRAEAALPGHVELIHVDALKFDFEALLDRIQSTHIGVVASIVSPAAPSRDGACGAATQRPAACADAERAPVRIVANLPYSVSSPLLRRFLDLRERLSDWSVMLQSEVAERLVAAPNSKDYGSLTVLHRLCVTTERLLHVPPQCFYPAPQVHSTVLRMAPLAQPLLVAGELEAVERVVRAAFGQRRKMLPKALAGGLGKAASSEQILQALAAAGIERTLRAEAVAPEKFLALTRALAASGAIVGNKSATRG